MTRSPLMIGPAGVLMGLFLGIGGTLVATGRHPAPMIARPNGLDAAQEVPFATNPPGGPAANRAIDFPHEIDALADARVFVGDNGDAVEYRRRIELLRTYFAGDSYALMQLDMLEGRLILSPTESIPILERGLAHARIAKQQTLVAEMWLRYRLAECLYKTAPPGEAWSSDTERYARVLKELQLVIGELEPDVYPLLDDVYGQWLNRVKLVNHDACQSFAYYALGKDLEEPPIGWEFYNVADRVPLLAMKMSAEDPFSARHNRRAIRWLEVLLVDEKHAPGVGVFTPEDQQTLTDTIALLRRWYQTKTVNLREGAISPEDLEEAEKWSPSRWRDNLK